MRDQTIWKDRVVDQSGEVIQEGTPQSAAHFNNIEEDLTDQEMAYCLTLNYLRMLSSYVDGNLKEEYQEVELENTCSQPFNDSAITVELQKERDNTKYYVDYDVIEYEDGLIGDVFIYDKQTNGFKIKFTGSARKAIIGLNIRGGYEA